jgi:hypothetical protein
MTQCTCDWCDTARARRAAQAKDQPPIETGPITKGWIGVDLDGTLAEYHGWQGLMHIGKPIEPMVRRIKLWLAAGLEVRIFTARMSPGKDAKGFTAEDFRMALSRWLEAAGLPKRMKATNVKDYEMLELYDDRAVQVEFNTGLLIGSSTRQEAYHNEG